MIFICYKSEKLYHNYNKSFFNYIYLLIDIKLIILYIYNLYIYLLIIILHLAKILLKNL